MSHSAVAADYRTPANHFAGVTHGTANMLGSQCHREKYLTANIFRAKVAIAAKTKTMVQKAGGHEGLLFLDVVANTQRNPIVHIFSRVKYTSVG